MTRFWIALPLLLAACDPGLPPGFPPVARLTVTPEYVESDVLSEIVLDGQASCDPIDFPDGCSNDPDGIGPDSACPGGVRFAWDIPFPHTVSAATPNRAQLRIMARLQRPTPVTLTVTDCDGRSHFATRMIGITD